MRLSLITKLTILTSLILVAFMALFAYVNLRELRHLFLDEAASDVDKLSETIIKTTHYQMLINDLPRVYEMMREVGTQESIRQIRMISKSGRIIFSTNDNEVGSILDKDSENLSMFNPAQDKKSSLAPRKKSRIFSDSKGIQLMGLSKAIYNEESCYTSKCHFHPENLRVLGVLEVTVSLEKMQKQLGAYRTRVISMTLILLILVWIGLTLCMQRMVNIPVQQLLRHAREVGGGNLEAEVIIASHDEMGTLASVMNEMTLGLKKSHDQLGEWGRTLEKKVAERTQELERMQAQLVRSEKLASLGELVAGIAHEINNPLTGILVFSSLIKNDSRLDAALKSDLETIIQETERCALIVKGLLDFARETAPQKSWISLNDVLEASLALVRNQALFQNITIFRDYSDDMPAILADPNQLEQVFINMLLNAGHAMITGGTLRVTTAKVDGTNGVVAKVADTGCGIPEENLARIFDPFFTTKDTSGTGLGLSVSYGIINSHGGTIEVESSVGIGTTFTIRLPINPDAAHDAGETKIPGDYTVW